MKRNVSLLIVALIALCFQVLLARPASAHEFTLTASANCTNGAPVISFTATSWNPGGVGGSNGEIDILFNGVKVFSGSFTPSSGQFTASIQAPSGTSVVTVEGVAIDNWDDGFLASDTPTVSVNVNAPTSCASGTGRFTGGGKQVIVNVVTLTKGFEVDCDLHQPSNNLEINWIDASGGSHHFHMDTLTSAVCTLNGNPVPPKAPVNTIVASGIGEFDNVTGFTVQFTLIDNGEPGTHDQAGFMVFETANPSNVVLAFPVMTVTTGNIQAHIDQR